VYNIPVTRIEEIFDQILHRQLQNVQPTDYIDVELNHLSLTSRVLVPFTPASEMSGDKALSVMERIQQSKESFKFDVSMVMKLVIVEMPQGGMHPNEDSNTRIVNWDEWYKKHCGHCGCFLQVNWSQIYEKLFWIWNFHDQKYRQSVSGACNSSGSSKIRKRP